MARQLLIAFVCSKDVDQNYVQMHLIPPPLQGIIKLTPEGRDIVHANTAHVTFCEDDGENNSIYNDMVKQLYSETRVHINLSPLRDACGRQFLPAGSGEVLRSSISVEQPVLFACPAGLDSGGYSLAAKAAITLLLLWNHCHTKTAPLYTICIPLCKQHMRHIIAGVVQTLDLFGAAKAPPTVMTPNMDLIERTPSTQLIEFEQHMLLLNDPNQLAAPPPPHTMTLAEYRYTVVTREHMEKFGRTYMAHVHLHAAQAPLANILPPEAAGT